MKGRLIRLFVWNGTDGMDQYIKSVGSGEFSGFRKNYYTNNIIDYVPYSEITEGTNKPSRIREDQWSYLRYNGDIRASYNNTQLYMASKQKTKRQLITIGILQMTKPRHGISSRAEE